MKSSPTDADKSVHLMSAKLKDGKEKRTTQLDMGTAEEHPKVFQGSRKTIIGGGAGGARKTIRNGEDLSPKGNRMSMASSPRNQSDSPKQGPRLTVVQAKLDLPGFTEEEVAAAPLSDDDIEDVQELMGASKAV